MGNLTKVQQILKLKALAEKNRGTHGTTRSIPQHELVELDVLFDRFKIPGDQWHVPDKYYARAVQDRSEGKSINKSQLIAKIVEENPGVIYIQ